jgi:hypothetical protein
MLSASPLLAQSFEPTLTVGAGIQAGFDHTQPEVGTSVDQFQLNHLRLYFNGDVEQKLPFARRVASEYCILANGRRVAAGAIGELTDEVVRAHLSVSRCCSRS